ncbi:MAG: hypothetical protein DRP82_05665 [Planctomycetota bacterium]|nr:MAG: hypothetical protein DRP82_05665 [Planctomycetota bacterium]
MRLCVVLSVVGLCLLVFGQEQQPPGPPKRVPLGIGWAVSRLPEELVKKFDKNGDGKLSDEEKVTALKTTFKEFMDKFDTNKDGKLSDEELTKVKEDVSKTMEEYKQRMIKRFDKDGDGKLSDEEKKAMRKAMMEKRKEMMEKRRKRRQEMHKKMLEKFDKDGDGKLNDEERKAMHEALMKRREEARKKAEEIAKMVFDTNKDGKVNEDEMRTMAIFWMWMRAKYGLKIGLRHRKPMRALAPQRKPEPQPKQSK